MTQSLPVQTGIEHRQESVYRMDRVRGETLESLKYRCKGGRAQRLMVETIFNYFADQHRILDAVDTEVQVDDEDKIDILVRCPDPMLSAPVVVGVEVDGPDHLKKDKYRQQTIRDSQRFIDNAIYPFHVANEEATRQPQEVLRRLLEFINNIFYLRYLTRREFWLSMEPPEPEVLYVPQPVKVETPAAEESNGQKHGTVPVTTNGHTPADDQGDEDEDDEVPF